MKVCIICGKNNSEIRSLASPHNGRLIDICLKCAFKKKLLIKSKKK